MKKKIIYKIIDRHLDHHCSILGSEAWGYQAMEEEEASFPYSFPCSYFAPG